MTMRDDFNEAHVSEAAEHVRKKLTEALGGTPPKNFHGCPVWRDDGLTLGESELAIDLSCWNTPTIQ